MNKFGLADDDAVDTSMPPTSLSDRLAAFPVVQPRARLDLAAVDAAAAPHGFVSREATPVVAEGKPLGRRRRAIPAEPTRHLAIRIVSSQYNRFVAYADRYQLTYHDALKKLLDVAGE
jgi:hypothetical protein